MADPLMPQEIRAFLDQQNWNTHHLRWHVERRWDTLSASARQWARQQGWQRVAPQEGAPGNGLDFLAMHRVMIRQLRERFPRHASLFDGWDVPPTDPDDPANPVPGGGSPEFERNMADAVRRLHEQLNTFASDDALGNYIQTRSRPTPGNPFRLDPDPSAGIHNYLHGRFADPDSDVDMGNPERNLGNQIFWRLHGWIDNRWSEYREVRGLAENDPEYVAALRQAEEHMADQGHGPHHRLLAPAEAVGTPGALPRPRLRIAVTGEDFQSCPQSQSVRLIDFDDAQVVGGIVKDTYLLMVYGMKPYLNMRVELVPRIYVRQPEFWEIEVVGFLPGIGLPVMTPYNVSLPLDGVRGTEGIEVVGAFGRLRLPVPPAGEGEIP